jgi:hypothetical protein
MRSSPGWRSAGLRAAATVTVASQDKCAAGKRGMRSQPAKVSILAARLRAAFRSNDRSGFSQ